MEGGGEQILKLKFSNRDQKGCLKNKDLRPKI